MHDPICVINYCLLPATLRYVRTTRFKSSFINYAVDHYVWSRLILKCLII